MNATEYLSAEHPFGAVRLPAEPVSVALLAAVQGDGYWAVNGEFPVAIWHRSVVISSRVKPLYGLGRCVENATELPVNSRQLDPALGKIYHADLLLVCRGVISQRHCPLEDK